jgi:hypothetical protein
VVGVVCCTGEVGYYGEDQIDWKMEIRTRIKIRTRKRDTILKDNLWRDFFDTELRSPSGKDPSPRRRILRILRGWGQLDPVRDLRRGRPHHRDYFADYVNHWARPILVDVPWGSRSLRGSISKHPRVGNPVKGGSASSTVILRGLRDSAPTP